LMKLCDIEGLLNCMHVMYTTSHRIVADALVGYATKPVELEDAITLEHEATSHYLHILLLFFAKLTTGANLPECEEPEFGSPEHTLLIGITAEYRIISFSLYVLREYLSLHEAATASSNSEHLCLTRRVLARTTPSIVSLLEGVYTFHEHQFVRHLPSFYPLFVDLMHCDSREVRQILCNIFSQRIGTVLHERR